MEVYTLGFAKKSAREFFGLLKMNGIKRLVDVRLNNTSQLAGFTKRDDLEYFLRVICDAEYQHRPEFSPTRELLDGWKKNKLFWEEYEKEFVRILENRKAGRSITAEFFATPTVFMCSEPTPEHCHRRLTVEYLAQGIDDVFIVHL